MKNDRKDGLYREYDPENGELIYEATYQYGRINGKERRLIVTNRYDYWEISTYINGRQSGPFESRYVNVGMGGASGDGNSMISMVSWKKSGKKPSNHFAFPYL